jgi:hypothetical protein
LDRGRSGQISICLGVFTAADPLFDEGLDLGRLDGGAGAQLEHGGDPFAPLVVGHADDGAVLYRRRTLSACTSA